MNAIAKFEKKHMAALESLAFISQQQKQLQEQEAEIKGVLLEGMKKYNITAIENDIVRINYVPESESVSIDTKKWRADDPDSYHEIEEKYNRRTKKSEYIRITVK